MGKRVLELIALAMLLSFNPVGCDVRVYEKESDEQVVVQKAEQKIILDETADRIYTENYAYNTLTQAAKEVYDQVLTTVLDYKETAEVSTTDIKVLEQAYTAVFADYGGLYWVSGYSYTQYKKEGEVIAMDFMPQYTMEQQERHRIQQQIDTAVEELLSGISMTDSDYEKAKYVFEMLVSHVDYDADAENNQNIVSVFLERASVCQGYACATQYLLKLLGIQSTIVTGSVNGEPHAWNLICLDGNYYYMDTTWGDSGYTDGLDGEDEYVNYSYLAATTEEISRTHRIENAFVLPKCVHMEDNYFVRENRYVSYWDPEQIGALLADAQNKGDGEVSLKFSTLELYERTLHYFITQQHLADYCENVNSVRYVEDRELYVLTLSLFFQ